MVRPRSSYVVRFYAVSGELRARITDANASRSWTIGDAESARLLLARLVHDDPGAQTPLKR